MRRHEPTCLAGDDQVFCSFHGRANNGETGGHRLKYGIGHTFPVRGVHQDVGRFEQVWDVVTAAQPMDITV